MPVLALAVVAAIWGVTFTVADEVAATLPAADLVAWRFGLGTAVLTLLPRSRAPLSRPELLHGVTLGLLLGAGFLLQTRGFAGTDALTSGFLTSLLVVFAPLASFLLFRERVPAAAWAAVALAAAGAAVLSLRAGGLGTGEVLTALAAALWGLHVVLLARWSAPGRALALARVQTATVTALALLVAAVVAVVDPQGRALLEMPSGGRGWTGIAFLAVLATAAAMALLTWAQARMSATRAAVVLTLEPAVAALTAVGAGTATLTVRTLLGGLLLVAAMYVVELRTRDRTAAGPVITGPAAPTGGTARPEPARSVLDLSPARRRGADAVPPAVRGRRR